jgi:hypothetical protein
MKCVLEYSHAFACGCLKDVLQAEGIESIITGENGAYVGGEGVAVADGLDLLLTEVWVNDKDFVKAAEITAEFRKSFTEEPKE